MNTKHTFWSLCKTYSKIEVPIIQRDYAQGRETPEAERIRKKFIDEYLINSLIRKEKIELDFVYGSVLITENGGSKHEVFIPLDGQQRLTTLFLLHWFIANKENRLNDAKVNLLKFTYETRPSAHDFCKKLIEECEIKNLKEIKQDILDSEWYNDDWNNDPTISGMLKMLDTFAKNESLLNSQNELFDSLISDDNILISFYFLPLEKFGLTENLYIRMNARGKMLSEFENFKSEFYKIIAAYPELLEDIKDKIEYAWVENLWAYKEKDSYVVDKPFMQYLSFLTEMLYYKSAKFRANTYISDFLDINVLKQIYSKKENIEFLVFSFDAINRIKEFNNENILWSVNTSLHDLFILTIEGKRDTNQLFIIFSALTYLHKGENIENFSDYIRVVRNLIHNTADNSRREWPKLLKSVDSMIQNKNIYDILLDGKFNDSLDGFYVPQRKEEIVKAKIINSFPTAKKLLFSIEDNCLLKGNIAMLISANYVSTETDLANFDITTCDIQKFNILKLNSIFEAYKQVSSDSFEIIWGDLLTSSLYTQSEWSRLTYSNNYEKHPAIISLAIDYNESSISKIGEFLTLRQKLFVKKIHQENNNISEIRDVKKQLYVYYILHKNIYLKDYPTFFKNGDNFGWLTKVNGYSSIFNMGIENDRYFFNFNPIFQTYQSQFRYNCGLKKENALDAEIVGAGRKNNPFELLINWANADI
jgi:hypothetical protein